MFGNINTSRYVDIHELGTYFLPKTSICIEACFENHLTNCYVIPSGTIINC